MLVLSRRPHEKMVFANLGISVEVVSVAGQKVKLGVDAPATVRVLRGELSDRIEESLQAIADQSGDKSLSHKFRNRLHTALLAIRLYRKQLEAGCIVEAETTLRTALLELESLDCELAVPRDAIPATQELTRSALLVEDDANERELLAGFLRLSGFRVDTVCDGVEALDFLRTHGRPDFVLLDMMMPRLDGTATVAAIRGDARFGGMRVFAVSGTERKAFDIPEGPKGCDRWFAKPVDPDELVRQMRRDLSASHATAC